jgi:CBS domain-containing protein
MGIVTDRDLVLQALADGQDPAQMTARQVMTANVISCHEADDIDNAVRLMEEHRVRRLPVLDRAGHLVGMVSVVDLSDRMPADIAAGVLSAVSQHPKALSA